MRSHNRGFFIQTAGSKEPVFIFGSICECDKNQYNCDIYTDIATFTPTFFVANNAKTKRLLGSIRNHSYVACSRELEFFE